MCPHTLWDDPTGLRCDNPSPTPHGHTYSATAGGVDAEPESDQ